MNEGNSGYTLSDIAAVTNGNNNGRSNNGLGEGNGAWWIILFLIFAFMGIGGNGWGNNGGNSNNGPTYIPVGGFGGFGGGTDTFASLQRQLDNAFSNLNAETNQIQQSISNGFYNTNTGILTSSANTNTNIANGFTNTNANIASSAAGIAGAIANTNLGIANGLAGVNSNIDRGIADTQRQMCQSTDAINANINTNGYETRLLGVNLISSLNQCCCDVKERLASDTCAVTGAIKDTNYNMSMNNNALLQALNTSTRDLIDNNNANYRALHDEIVANRMEDKNATIAQLREQVNMQNLAASQAQQNNYLVNQLRPCPIPAYLTCSPYAAYPYQGCGCNNNNGCNCGNA